MKIVRILVITSLIFSLLTCRNKIKELLPEEIILNYLKGQNNADFELLSKYIADNILITEGDYVIAKSKSELYTNFQWDSTFLPKYQLLDLKVINDGFEATISKIDQRIKYLHDTSIIYKVFVNFSDNLIVKMQTNDYVVFDFEKWQKNRESLVAWTDSLHPELSGFLNLQTRESAETFLKAINLYQKAH